MQKPKWDVACSQTISGCNLVRAQHTCIGVLAHTQHYSHGINKAVSPARLKASKQASCAISPILKYWGDTRQRDIGRNELIRGEDRGGSDEKCGWKSVGHAVAGGNLLC